MKLDIFQMLDVARQELGEDIEIRIAPGPGARYTMIQMRAFDGHCYHASQFGVSREAQSRSEVNVIDKHFRMAVENVRQLMARGQKQ